MRHGEYDRNLPEKPLSTHGIDRLLKSVEILKNIFRREDYEVFSSPAKRCIQTSSYIIDASRIRISDSLDEKSSYNEVDSFLDDLLAKGINSILVTHKPQIDIILHKLDLCDVDLEPSGFIYLEIMEEPKIIAVIQPSIIYSNTCSKDI